MLRRGLIRVAEVGVFPILDDRGEPVSAAACVPVADDDAATLPQSLHDWQRNRLPEPLQARRIWAARYLPKTMSGKLSRAALRRMFGDNGAADGISFGSSFHSTR